MRSSQVRIHDVFPPYGQDGSGGPDRCGDRACCLPPDSPQIVGGRPASCCYATDRRESWSPNAIWPFPHPVRFAPPCGQVKAPVQSGSHPHKVRQHRLRHCFKLAFPARIRINGIMNPSAASSSVFKGDIRIVGLPSVSCESSTSSTGHYSCKSQCRCSELKIPGLLWMERRLSTGQNGPFKAGHSISKDLFGSKLDFGQF
jgi:hypothetical protein